MPQSSTEGKSEHYSIKDICVFLALWQRGGGKNACVCDGQVSPYCIVYFYFFIFNSM